MSSTNESPEKGFATRAIHGGQRPDPSTGAVMPPVYLTSTYAQTEPGVHQGFEYSRTRNPTRDALQASLASLERGSHAIAFASGLAATHAVLSLLSAGDRIVLGHDVYGGTYRLVEQVMKRWGLAAAIVDTTDLEQLRSALAAAPTKLVWFESPTNPLLHVTDIAAACALAKEAGAISVVDNTFATPYLQAPLDLGADLVVHSTTKYLGGHSDVVGGAVVTRNEEAAERLGFLQNAIGAVPGPLDCFLVLRGIKTLSLRMERHCDSAEQIAAWLSDHPSVRTVFFPGLPGHPNHEVAEAQMRRPGGMISFDVDADLATATRLAASTRLFTLAESLGGVESLLDHPASMTHGSIPREERLKSGFTDGLLRLSVGLEDVDDLLEDLDSALRAAFR